MHKTPQYAVYVMLDTNQLSSLPIAQSYGCVWLFDSEEAAHAWRLRKLVEAGEITQTDPLHPPVANVRDERWVRFDDAVEVWEQRLEISEFFHVYPVGAEGLTIGMDNLGEISGQLSMF